MVDTLKAAPRAVVNVHRPSRPIAYVRNEQARCGYFFILPTLLFFCVFIAFPLLFSFT